MSDTEILPCPWCGQTPTEFGTHSNGKWGFVQCCIEGPEIRAGYTPLHEWRDKAIAEWNDRKPAQLAAPVASTNLPPLPEPGAWYYVNGECFPTDGYTAAQMIEYALAAQDDNDPNASWLSLAHLICADAGIPPGHIMGRLEALRDKLEAAQGERQPDAYMVEPEDGCPSHLFFQRDNAEIVVARENIGAAVVPLYRASQPAQEPTLTDCRHCGFKVALGVKPLPVDWTPAQGERHCTINGCCGTPAAHSLFCPAHRNA